MKQSPSELAPRFEALLLGTSTENFDDLSDDLFFCASKRDGEFDALLALVSKFLVDERVSKVNGLSGLFITVEAELDCFDEAARQALINASVVAFPRIPAEAQFSLCELWGKMGTRHTVEAIGKLSLQDAQSRNFAAHALQHISVSAKDEEVATLAEEAMKVVGGNPEVR